MVSGQPRPIRSRAPRRIYDWLRLQRPSGGEPPLLQIAVLLTSGRMSSDSPAWLEPWYPALPRKGGSSATGPTPLEGTLNLALAFDPADSRVTASSL